MRSIHNIIAFGFCSTFNRFASVEVAFIEREKTTPVCVFGKCVSEEEVILFKHCVVCVIHSLCDGSLLRGAR